MLVLSRDARARRGHAAERGGVTRAGGPAGRASAQERLRLLLLLRLLRLLQCNSC